jgi:hypothetical protein
MRGRFVYTRSITVLVSVFIGRHETCTYKQFILQNKSFNLLRKKHAP